MLRFFLALFLVISFGAYSQISVEVTSIKHDSNSKDLVVMCSLKNLYPRKKFISLPIEFGIVKKKHVLLPYSSYSINQDTLFYIAPDINVEITATHSSNDNLDVVTFIGGEKKKVRHKSKLNFAMQFKNINTLPKIIVFDVSISDNNKGVLSSFKFDIKRVFLEIAK